MSENNFRKGPHAAKNKIDEEVEVVETNIPQSDERKTVVLDEDLEGVEFDDKVWLYWKRNKNFIVFSIAAAFAIVIGVQGWKMWQANHGKSIAAAFERANTSAELETFAKSHKGTNLAGVALLQLGDESYKAGKFAEALNSYKGAISDLSGTVLEGRVLLGCAICQYSIDPAKGISELKAVYGNANLAQAYRGQAGYLYGLALKSAKNIDEAKAVLKEVSGNAANGAFSGMAREALGLL